MFKIIKYCLFDLFRSRWTIIYTAFFFLLTFGLIWISPSFSKVIISLLNIILILVPLIAMMFSVMYYYNAREFTELLLSQPLPRRSIFLGQYLSIAISLSLSLLVGVGIPFLIYGITFAEEFSQWIMLLTTGTLLSFIFSSIAYLIALIHENRIKGFGLTMLTWLFFAVIYDGIFLLLLFAYNEYPLDNFALSATMFNPIDLSRVMILLHLDISALMGYTGAVFQKVLGNNIGVMFSLLVLLLWVVLPTWGLNKLATKKDF